MLNSQEMASILKRGQLAANNDPFVVLPLPNIEKMKTNVSTTFDVHLGRWFLAPRTNQLSVIDEEDSDVPRTSAVMNRVFVPFEDTFHLHPGNFVLGGTLEWLRVPKNLAGNVVGKSSWGRRGLVIETASAIHPGFTGCLTLEITNLGEVPIVLRPGMAVGQICMTKIYGKAESGTGRLCGYRRPELGQIRHDNLAEALLPEPQKKKSP